MFRLSFILLFIISTVSAHAEVNLRKVNASDLPALEVEDADQGSWEAGSRSAFKNALDQQLVRCISQSQNETWNFAGKKVTRARWCVQTIGWFLAKLEKASSLNEVYTSAMQELEWYESVGRPDTKDVLFTGYYYPSMKARRTANGKYKYPIYRKPSDMVQVVIGGEPTWRRKVKIKGKWVYRDPFTREQIVGGALRNRGLEIAYADNPIDPYMLEVQGSGELDLVNDRDEVVSRIKVNYSSQNGHQYQSLGKYMRENGIPESYINLQGIRRYFGVEHPELWLKFSNHNPAFVFFGEATNGPFGSAGVELTPKHSVAVDTSEFAMGVVGLIHTERPAKIEGGETVEWKKFSQFVITQDTGGAIKSPGRVDIFYGPGSYAEVAAGQTQHLGRFFLMLVK